MGDPKKQKKQYDKPRKSFQKERLEKERGIKKLYGLKNNREFLRAETIIRGKRTNARKLLALSLENRTKREKEIIDSLKKIGILRGSPTLDDVLTLTPEALLERRLQTIVWRKGLANSVKQSRQFITHGHIAVDGKRVSIPSYIVAEDDEGKVAYFGKEMVIQEKKVKAKVKDEKKNELKDKFEEAKGKEGEAKPVAKEEAKTEVKAEAKAEAKPAAKAEVKKEAKPEVRAEAKKEEKKEEKKVEAKKE
jgi:small subunit ribosomal protein S4